MWAKHGNSPPLDLVWQTACQKLGNQLFIKRSDLQALSRNHKATTQKTSNWPQLIKEMKALREDIRKHAGNFDITELIEESRKGLR